MHKQPNMSSVFVHNAYNEKKKKQKEREKCIPVGLYRLLCLKARRGTAVWLMLHTSDEVEKPPDVC